MSVPTGTKERVEALAALFRDTRVESASVETGTTAVKVTRTGVELRLGSSSHKAVVYHGSIARFWTWLEKQR